jgi:2',3'-cyclic-nucleotide 2'-phosphodiesterase (5'-nucleotidase family)
VFTNPDYISEDSPSSSGLHNNNIPRIFSGGAFSPSLEAAVLRGGHMAPVLDGLGVDAACYGNHDFDFGEMRLAELARQTRFPWLLANAVSGKDGNRRLLAGAREYLVKEVAGYRIGFFGLAGRYG